MTTIKVSPQMLALAAANLCTMRGVKAEDRENGEGSPSFLELAKAELVSALQVQSAIHLAFADGSPTIFNALDEQLN